MDVFSNHSARCLLVEKVSTMSADSGHYDELFQTPNMSDLEPMDYDQEESGNEVCVSLKPSFHSLHVQVMKTYVENG